MIKKQDIWTTVKPLIINFAGYGMFFQWQRRLPVIPDYYKL